MVPGGDGDEPGGGRLEDGGWKAWIVAPAEEEYGVAGPQRVLTPGARVIGQEGPAADPAASGIG